MTSSTSSPKSTNDPSADARAGSGFTQHFPQDTSIFAMLHLKGDDAHDRLERAQQEIDLLWDRGVDAIIVENYFGNTTDVDAVLNYLVRHRPDAVFGINILNDDWLAFDLADQYGARFIQLDSVAGHLHPPDDRDYGDKLAARRYTSAALVLGGVRFKYQPILSGRTVDQDLHIAKTRCDAVVVTGQGTGQPTPTVKIVEFRHILGPDFPLIVGAGVTVTTATEQLQGVNGVIVGSALKDTHTDTGDVRPDNVEAFVNTVRNITPTH